MDFLSNLSPERQKDFWELMSQKSIRKLDKAVIRARVSTKIAVGEPSDENCRREHNATKDMVSLFLWASEIIKDVRQAAGMPEEEPYNLMDEEEAD